jgi:hypothetical protein
MAASCGNCLVVAAGKKEKEKGEWTEATGDD